jgi:Immunoglobulin domain/Immunoglobulin I-set domain
LMRSFLPTQALAPNAWGFILKIGVGATALMGFDAVSRASGISISPSTATVGVPYTGTITYSGGHASAVSSMSYLGTCLGSQTTFIDGLKIVDGGGDNHAQVSGTPTNAGNFTFSIEVYKASSCGSGHNDTRSNTLAVVASGGGGTPPSFVGVPQPVTAQVGSDVILSATATGNPLPTFQWLQGITSIAGATNSSLTIPAIQLTNAGVYTCHAINTNGTVAAACYVTVVQTPGAQPLALDYTNFYPAGNSLTLFSYMTNVLNATNTYSWNYNGVAAGITTNNLSIPPSGATPAKSGVYTVIFNSIVPTNSLIGTNNTIVNQQTYDVYTAFGYVPVFTNSLPATTNSSAGSSVTFNIGVGGTLNFSDWNGGTLGYGTSSIPCVFWYKDGNLVASQTYTNVPLSLTNYSNTFVNASLTLNSVTAATNGYYTVVVTNYWGSITSTPVALTVTGGGGGSAPGFSQQPLANISLLVGQSTNISVTATGTPSLFYQWRTNGVNLANGGVYSGVNTNILLLTAVTTNNRGNYTVVVTNASGSVTSSVANVSVYSLPSMVVSNSGSGTVGFNGITATGITYVVMAATNLVPPNWVDILTNNTGLSGNINFRTNTTSGASQYYKLRFP